MKHEIWITGIIPAVFTPLDNQGNLNLAMVEPIVSRLVSEGASGLYVCGSTGEGPSLTREERMAVAQAYVQAADGRLPVIVQVGHESLTEAQLLAANASSIGADAISAVPPIYFGVHSLEQLVLSLNEICIAAPALPFYYYHIPRLTSIQIDVLALLEEAKEKLPSMRGIKYSDFTIFEMQACVDFDNGRFNILFGSDEMLLSGLIGGADGAVGTTYSFALPLYRRIFTAFKSDNLTEAKRLQSMAVEMVRRINHYGQPGTNLPAMKSMMKLIGQDCGPLRLPLPSLSGEQEQALYNEMKAIDFFSWGRRPDFS
jgi:N-acetylneuraminate lyase